MIATANLGETTFLREYLMARGKIDLKTFGVSMEKKEFEDRMVEEFGNFSRGAWTLDEMLLRPANALRFCQDVRSKYGWMDLPDDVILRTIINARKYKGKAKKEPKPGEGH